MKLSESKSFKQFLNEKEILRKDFENTIKKLEPTQIDNQGDVMYALWYDYNSDEDQYEGVQLQVDEDGTARIYTRGITVEECYEANDPDDEARAYDSMGIDEMWNDDFDEPDFEGTFEEALDELKTSYDLSNTMTEYEYKKVQKQFIG